MASRRFTTEAMKLAGLDELAVKGLAGIALLCLGAGGKAIYDHYGDVRMDIKDLQKQQATGSKAIALSLAALEHEQKRMAEELKRVSEAQEKVLALLMNREH